MEKRKEGRKMRRKKKGKGKGRKGKVKEIRKIKEK